MSVTARGSVASSAAIVSRDKRQDPTVQSHNTASVLFAAYRDLQLDAVSRLWTPHSCKLLESVLYVEVAFYRVNLTSKYEYTAFQICLSRCGTVACIILLSSDNERCSYSRKNLD
jgi:hypothetical protein